MNDEMDAGRSRGDEQPEALMKHDSETDIGPAVRSLVGKELCDGETTETTFAKDDLPPGTRIIHAPGGWANAEHAPSRLTVIVGDDGKVTHVFTG
ncbi:uncharacterized protein DNG_06766 [Cephalotrichum gorgonifer]|uniref:Uncharacterized protein n=1 Tax=Cephalotrichum gorgonifer TaxID=2041049 RepID=A0AAE8N290_9PEZI|nr:uncharacterized protein DNG_06766 [Cephalotrichum gorgonifer]